MEFPALLVLRDILLQLRVERGLADATKDTKYHEGLIFGFPSGALVALVVNAFAD